jgi:hypothetical protein
MMSRDRSLDPRRGRAAVRILAVASVVLLLATITLGVITFRLLDQRATAAPSGPDTAPPSSSAKPSSSATSTRSPGPSPTRSPTAAPLPETQPRLMSQGVPVLVRSDFTVRELAMTRWEPDVYTELLAPVERTDGAAISGTVYVDVTAYDEDGNIIERSPTTFSWRPGQTLGVISLAMMADLPSAARFVIEQTLFEEHPFDVTGELAVGSVTVGEAYGLETVADFSLTSTLSGGIDIAEVGILGSVDGRLFAACVSPVEVPAGPVFADDCIWKSVSSEFVPDTPPAPPAGATYEVTLSF